MALRVHFVTALNTGNGCMRSLVVILALGLDLASEVHPGQVFGCSEAAADDEQNGLPWRVEAFLCQIGISKGDIP